DIGPIAGWPVHTSVAHSRELIQNYLMAKAIFAVNLKTAPNHAIGSVGLELVENGGGQPFMGANDAEIGYWIGVPYWGQGLIPEAAEKI
ncbi:GNAT family N-acetyltransferase, partial [Staphylococcus epidermidis]